ncbi:MAG: class I SAM-dependent methyltransferase [Cyanobacteriota bacterium]|nr:class I SAM-dependent methyltransferase [Cyanobacteriota bacterium]
MILDEVQQTQETGYCFPYHHIPDYKKGFTQCYNFPWGINYAATLEFLGDRLKQETFNSLIDVGCGDGRIAKEMRTRFKNKVVEGVDYSPRSIKMARAFDEEGTYHNLNIIEDSLNRRYDLALLIEVFEHIPPDLGDRFLQAVANLLEDNGTLILTVPHSNVPTEPKHYRHFSVQTLSRCLEPYFEIVETLPFEKIDWRKKGIDLILTNKLFILNSGKLKNALYRYYKKHLFYVKGENSCKRIYIKAKVKR